MNRRAISACGAWAAVTLSGCATYHSDPIEPREVLNGLNAFEWDAIRADSHSDGSPATAVGPRELSAVAVSTNPVLKAARAEIGIRRALLVEAGLLPDPEVGWDAMNVVASQVILGGSSAVDTVSGIGLMFPLLRPGERGARIGAAEWRAEEAKRRVAAAEWSLTRDIHIAYEEVQAAELLLAQTQALTELAQSTYEYFKRALEGGAATGIEANLALGEFQSMRLETIRVSVRMQESRQALNALLGLPPAVEIVLGPAEDPSASEVLRDTTEVLTSHAVESRPDLAVLLARYQAAEEELRLAFSKQYPQLSIGSGFGLILPLFSKFGRPAMRTAIARRETLRAEFTAAVHSVRQEIAAAHMLWEFAQREVELVENELLPNAEENLELSKEAFRAGEVTLLQTLALQRALVQARTQSTETRAERSKRAWALLAASGWLLGPDAIHNNNHHEDSR